MKKIAFFLLIIIPLFSGCSKKKDGLNKSNINLYANERYQLKFKGDSDMPIRWSSDDSYVAEVTNLGEVIANKVGETIIYANNAKCKVNVIPKYNIYDEPITEWGITQSQVKSLWGNPDEQDGNIWAYYDDNEDVDLIIFYFDRNDRLYGFSIILYTAYTSQWKELTNFLNERYVIAPLTHDNYDLIYMNGFDLDDVTTIIGVGEDFIDVDYSIIDYLSIDSVTILSRGNDEIKLNIPDREDIIKNFLNKKKSKE